MSDRKSAQGSSPRDELRYFPRWHVDDRVIFQLDGGREHYDGQTKDLSCAGACIISSERVEPRQKINITVYLSEDTKIKLNGYVLWVGSDQGRVCMGVSFYDTPDAIQDLILQHAFKINKDQVLKQWYKGWDGS